MKARNGKIARLPEEIRRELNRRILNGQEGREILPWLNNQPTVRDILDRKFGGCNINRQNLSAWRTGGFRDWDLRREIIITSMAMGTPVKAI
jgi:hypothetical protein